MALKQLNWRSVLYRCHLFVFIDGAEECRRRPTIDTFADIKELP